MISLIELHHYPIWEQLRLEEALLKADDRQWCILNLGSPDAIVMGISGKQEKVVEQAQIDARPVPVVRRFSGGGTVYVDSGTLFITFICQSAIVGVQPKQKPILDWTEEFYRPIFGKDFRVSANDYAYLDRKFGGNAQYLRKGRWLHHTSFLWDYDPACMDYLKMPEKMPEYRQGRSHQDFLCKLSDRFAEPEDVLGRFKNELAKRFGVQSTLIEEARTLLDRQHHRSTELIALSC